MCGRLKYAYKMLSTQPVGYTKANVKRQQRVECVSTTWQHRLHCYCARYATPHPVKISWSSNPRLNKP